MENKFREFWIVDNTDNSGYLAFDRFEREKHSGACNRFHVVEYAAVEQLKVENERLNKLAEGISAREESISAECKLRIEIESENAALKSKLKIASAALEVVKVHNGINAHYPIVYATVTQALRDVGEI